MKTKKTIAIIPARGGSKRIPQKNIMDLGGLPLIVHSINYAKSNDNIIDDIYVSTDDEKIKNIALANGVKVIDRPKSISGDTEPTITAIQHLLEVIDDVDNVVLLQPTNPLRHTTLLQEGYQLFMDLKLNSLFTVTRDEKKLGKIIDNQYQPFNYKIGQRSQDLEPLYYENGLLYLTTSKTIRDGFIISSDAYPLVVNDKYTSIDIDTHLDFEYAEFILKNDKKF